MEALINQPVVIDNGSGVLKCGLAGAEQPSHVIPSIIGRPKHTRIMAGSLSQDVLIGMDALNNRGLCRINYPLQHGITESWSDQELLWSHAYQQMGINCEDHPLLITEAPLNPRRNRDLMAQVLFETFNVPALYVSLQAVLALYASGRTTGVVLDIGDGTSHCVPIYEGFAIPQAIHRVNIAGRDVTNYMAHLLRCGDACKALDFWTSAEMDLCRTIKEKCSYVASFGQLGPQQSHLHDIDYEEYVLPDGQVVKIGSERYLAPEILFKPEIVGSECVGVHEMLVNSINKVDLDLRRLLYENIILSGGTTLLKGFGSRLLAEVKQVSMRDVKIKIFAPPERKYSTWIGGSILASLSTFKKLWITAEEYEEDPEVIHKKFM
ncbi:hypothetical protein MP228_003251 [Amoeboaphelidium protococcarum]|nr:hypothetical protein MP228_003251 [Amoeboaphelidium protococcarum]